MIGRVTAKNRRQPGAENELPHGVRVINAGSSSPFDDPPQGGSFFVRQGTVAKTALFHYKARAEDA
jgi:hypothetical protein